MTAASDLTDAVAASVAAVNAATPDPADRLRLMASLAATPGQGLAAAMCRRVATIALAAASAAYEASSYDEAQAVLGLVQMAIDAAITEAGDAEDDEVYQALQALRAATVADLTARGADLAPLVTRRFGTTLPALVVAQRLYSDATRADEMVARVDPIHPAFMPVVMQVLAS